MTENNRARMRDEACFRNFFEYFKETLLFYRSSKTKHKNIQKSILKLGMIPQKPPNGSRKTN